MIVVDPNDPQKGCGRGGRHRCDPTRGGTSGVGKGRGAVATGATLRGGQVAGYCKRLHEIIGYFIIMCEHIIRH